jgi:hypothetical protein
MPAPRIGTAARFGSRSNCIAGEIARTPRRSWFRIASLPAQQDGYRIVFANFIRARSQQRAANVRSILTEYRFRLFAD